MTVAVTHCVYFFFTGDDKQNPKPPSVPPSSSPSSSSVTTQPAPRWDFPLPPVDSSASAPAPHSPCPDHPPPGPEPQQPAPCPPKEEQEHAAEAPKKDLLEIDRFTICGNRIDWAKRHKSKSLDARCGSWLSFRDVSRQQDWAGW